MPPRKTRNLAEVKEPAKVLFYGIPGTGKTTCAAHLARLGDVQYIAADRSLRQRAMRRLALPVDRIEMVEELSPLVLDEEYCWRWMEEEQSGTEQSYVLDTATELVARSIESQVDEAWKDTVEAARAVEAEITDAERKKRYFVPRDYYSVETQEMRRLLRHLRDLRGHVAITAQRRRDVDEDTGFVMYGPDVNPAIQGDLMGYCNQVIELDLDDRFYIGHTRPRPNHHAKDRDGLLPSILVSPTMDRVVAYLDGDLSKDDDPIQAEYREFVKARNRPAPARSRPARNPMASTAPS